MKSELLLLGAAGAVIALIVVYMLMNQTGDTGKRDVVVEKVVEKVKKAKTEKNEAQKALATAGANLAQLKAAADMAKAYDPTGSAAAVSNAVGGVLSQVKVADEKLDKIDPAVSSMVGTVASGAAEWLSDPANRAWAWQQGKSLYNYLDRPQGKTGEENWANFAGGFF